jgi:atrial natriuretic peptide receptor A
MNKNLIKIYINLNKKKLFSNSEFNKIILFLFYSKVNYFLASFYDAMHIYIKALNQTITSKNSINNIPEVLKNIWKKEFDGVTGHIVIDDYGERMGEFAMHDLDPVTQEFKLVISSVISTNSDVIIEYDPKNRPIYWYDRSSGELPDSPTCGYNRAKCPVKEPLPIWVWLLVSMGVLMIIMITIGIIFYR